MLAEAELIEAYTANKAERRVAGFALIQCVKVGSHDSCSRGYVGDLALQEGIAVAIARGVHDLVEALLDCSVGEDDSSSIGFGINFVSLNHGLPDDAFGRSGRLIGIPTPL